MRWGGGFFRLWIAATIIWTTTVVTFVGKESFDGLWKPSAKYEVSHESGISLVLDSSQSPEVLKTQMIDAVKQTAALLEQQGDQAGAKKQLEWAAGNGIDEVVKAVADEKAERADRLRGALSRLLGPPFGLLALGLMTAWVANGFRR